MNKLLLRLGVLVLSFALSLSLFAQDRVITGKVSSNSDNTLLPGVSIVVKGTTRGTTTDNNGDFKLTVPANATLIFSYIGFTSREIKVGNQSVINLELSPDESTLNEVVVTAMGIKKEKKLLGYSTQDVKGQDIIDTGRDNFLVALQGRVAGLTMTPTSGQPGASVSIQLRGASSIGGNNQPLYVVDGLPIDNRTFSQEAYVNPLPNRDNDYLNRAADINPNDIESITVLKGPEAAALYGIDASAGAILITTKKGSGGKGKITYDNNFRFEDVYRFPQVQKVYGRGINGAPDPNTQRFFGPKLPENTQFYDNFESFFRTGFTQKHSLGFEGGKEGVTYRWSTTYTDQAGTVPTSAFKTLSTRLTATANLTSKLKATTSFSFVNTQVVKPIRSEYGFLIGLLTWPSYDDVSNYLNPDGTRRRLIADTGEYDNPLFSVNKNKNTDRTKRTIGNFSLEYTPTTWLNIIGRFGADNYSTLGNSFLHPESNRGLVGRGTIDNYTENSQLLNGNLLITAKKAIGDFNTSFLLGGSVDDRNYEVTAVRGEKLYLPDYNSINNTDPATQRNKLTITRQRLLGVFGKLDIDYKNYLSLSITGRNDWSSTLPKANNSFFYPSVSMSFVFTDLPSMKGQFSALSFGKIRASYAQTGKDAIPYRVRARLVPQTTTGGGFIYDFYGDNPNLNPERSSGFEVGTELKFFKNRLGLEVAYYSNERSKQIVVQRLSYGTGFIFGLLNGGTFSNRGVEITLTGSPIRTPSFSWDATVNFSKLKTDVRNLPADVAEYYNSDTWLYGNARASAFVNGLDSYYSNINLAYNRRGEGSATAIGGYSYLRNNKGDILISPATGLPITNTNFLPIGDRNPDFTMGVTNMFRYKNLQLSFLLDIRKGGDVYNGNERYLYAMGLSTRTLDRDQPVVFKGVLRDGLENTDNPTANNIQVTPATRLDYYTSALPESEFVEKDINWLRLRDVTLSYRLPTTLLNRTGFLNNASVFVTGTDLFLLTNYTGADPSINGNSASTLGVGGAGFDFGTLALARAVSFGVRIGL
ncbi:SusC/RagA family TonB-linked outer membrane protein [Runella zeae]|uniref:SusC/RagA family TonB-linked outer membrane protein n=1 Tax=Runella zeae TaxID=94255 RepID=UPI002355DB4B|nr:SusC/RagA family TonB-linked outer membrane protein [Runella zeae]